MSATDVLVVDLAKEDETLKLYPHAALLSSHRAGWDEVQLEYHQQPPHQVPENCSKQHRIIIHTQSLPSHLVEQMNQNRFQTEQPGDGAITVIPANINNWACWDKERQFITLSFESSIFARYTSDLIDTNDAELIPSFSQPDLLVHGIGLALKSELESGGFGSRLYIDSLTAALMTHLLRHYSAQKYNSQTYADRLPKRRLQQVTDYITHHLEQNLTLAELAEIAQMSPSYFSNLFKQSIGLAPHQYVIQCKIERAKQLLLQGKLTIAEVAHSLGFAHQSHLSRHFKRLVGVTPKAFLKSQ